MSKRWFDEAKFGIFMHWGITSIHCKGDLVKGFDEISTEDYDVYYKNFNPEKFDAKQWVSTIVNSGAKYIVFTTKHVDGFCNFDTEYTDFKITNTKFKRDMLREFIDELQKTDIKIGFYYALIDWHHPEYPHYGDKSHPMRNNAAFKDVKHDFSKYIEYFHNQVCELATKYGKADLFWFDYSYDDMMGEKWEATKLINKLKSINPDIVINNRFESCGENYGSLVTDNPTPYAGDYITPEEVVPLNGIKNTKGERVKWESCLTLTDHWYFNSNDINYKSPEMLVRTLVDITSKGGNMLLNISPMPNGLMDNPTIDVLAKVGEWLEHSGDSVYGTVPAELNIVDYGRITKKDNSYYYHVMMDQPAGFIPLHGLKKDNIASIKILKTGQLLEMGNHFAHINFPDTPIVSIPSATKFPDEINTVIKIEYNK